VEPACSVPAPRLPLQAEQEGEGPGPPQRPHPQGEGRCHQGAGRREHEAPKTKDFAALLKAFELNTRKSLLVVPTKDDNVLLSARNIQGARVVVASELNTYDIMNANGLLIVKDAIAPLEATLTK
jgi:ribosomal protein L4